MSRELHPPVPSIPGCSSHSSGTRAGQTLYVAPGQTFFLFFFNSVQKSCSIPRRAVPAHRAQEACPVRVGRGGAALPRHPAPTFGCELRRLCAEVPEADCCISRAARQVPGTGGTAGSAQGHDGCSMETCPTHSRSLVLSRGAEGNGDDGLGVSLQGAGAARHRPHPEHGLWLVDDVENLLCLHCLPCQGLLQRNDNLGIVEEEGQRHRLILEVKLQESGRGRLQAPGAKFASDTAASPAAGGRCTPAAAYPV